MTATIRDRFRWWLRRWAMRLGIVRCAKCGGRADHDMRQAKHQVTLEQWLGMEN